MGITDPAEEYFKDGAWGHDASRWQKLALLWGFTDTYSEAEVDNDTSAGTVDLTFSTVPSGEVWVVTNLLGWNASTAASHLQVYATINSVPVILRKTAYSTPTRYTDWQGFCVLASGDYIWVRFEACAAHDVIYARACGYKMAVS